MIIQGAKRLDNVQEYYFSRKDKEIKEMLSRGLDVINLGIGSPDLCPSDATINSLIESASEPGNHGYQSYKGLQAFREALSWWCNETYGISLNSNDEILPLIGSKEGIIYISMAFVNEGDIVLVPNPGYPTYTSVSKLVGAEIKYYELVEENNWAPDFENLEKMDLTNVKIMWANYPHMPTGSRASDETFEQLIDFAKKHKILICNDNPYSLVLNETAPKSILGYDNAREVAIELNSLSKSHNMAGWRLGWISGRNDYIDTILKVTSNVHSGIFLPFQHAAISALNNSREWHNERNEEYRKRREIVWQIADELNCHYKKDQVGLFIWAKVPERIENVESFLDEILKKTNVFITPGYIFGNRGDRYIRISLCSKIERLIEALKRIKNYCKFKLFSEKV